MYSLSMASFNVKVFGKDVLFLIAALEQGLIAVSRHQQTGET